MAPLRLTGLALLALFLALVRPAQGQEPRVTEFLAVNNTGILDDDNTPQGWIEIWNPSATVNYSLANWKLTDGTTTWTFPSVQLPPKDRMIVWASGKNRVVPAAPLHTSFKLNAAGGTLQLLRTDNSIASAFNGYPAQLPDVSYGRDDADTNLVGAYDSPTPEQPNNYVGTGVAGDVLFSRAGGPITTAFQLTLSQAVPVDGAVIRYTINGGVPTSASPLYSTPINITSTMIVRARVFMPGKLPGEPEAQCYLLLDATTTNFSSGMPIVVLTNFGIGTPTSGDAPEVPDNPGYMWVFQPGADGRSRFTNPPDLMVRVGMDRRGSSTLGNPKYNLNIETRKDRGDFEKSVPLLGMSSHSDWVFYAPYAFDRSLIRNMFMYSLSNQLGRWASHGVSAEVFLDINGGALNFTNAGSGDYFGVYNVFEKIRRDKNRLNISGLDRYDNGPVTKTGGYIWKVDRRDTGDSGFTTTHETTFAYYSPKEVDLISNQRDPQEQYLKSYCQQFDTACFSANFKDPTVGYRAYLDVPAAIDHHLLNVLPMNVDGLRLSGYIHKDRGGKIEYGPIWDFDRTIDSTDNRDDSPTTWRSQVSDFGTDFFNYTWWTRLFSDIDFYQAYIDRWAALRANNGPFSTTSINALLDQLNSQITAEAVQRDLNRWAQTKRSWTSPFTGVPYTGQTAEVQRMKDWLQQRSNWMETQWVGKVTVSPSSGTVTPGTLITLTGPANATIYYTTDGSDPRPSGGAQPTAANVKTYSGPFTVDATTRIRARAYNPAFTALTGANNPPLVSKWSGRMDARFAVEAPAAPGSLAVTEVHYHPAAPSAAELAVNPQFTDSDFEFLELRNIGATPVDLANAKFTDGIVFSFTGENALSLAPGEYVIVASNPTAFALRYGAKPNVVGPYQGDLANGGEHIALAPATGATNLVDFTYDDIWYIGSDGAGNSIVVYDQTAAPEAFSTPANWRLSSALGGSPGTGEAAFVTTLLPTEIGATSATLNASISTNGAATAATFVMGDLSYPLDPTAANVGVVNVSKTLTDLLPHTTYTVRADATNTLGNRTGNVVEFTTLNRDPAATAKDLHVTTSAAFQVDVLAGCTDPDGDTLTISDVTQGQKGAVTIEGNKVVYTPGAGFTGNDTFTYTVDDGFGGNATATVTMHNVAPVAQGDTITVTGAAVTFDPRTNDSDADLDALSIAGVTNGAVGTVTVNPEGTVTYTAGPAFFGQDSFTYMVSDGVATSTATVMVRTTVPVLLVGAVQGQQVPGQPLGTTYLDLSLPNNGVISGKVKPPTGPAQAAIFRSDGTVQLKVGDPAPLIANATITKLGQLSGQAVIATIKGSGASASTDLVLYAGLNDTIRIAAREGDGLIAGTKIKQFLSVDGNGTTVFFLVKLAGGGVRPTNDLAVAASPDGAATRVLLREGGLLEGSVVSQIGTLLSSRPTLAEGRWRFDSSSVGVRLTLPGKEQALYSVRAGSEQPDVWTLWTKTSALTIGQSSAKSLGLPGFGPDGVAYTTQLIRGITRGVTASNDSVLLRATDEGNAVLATKGSAAPGADGQPLPGVTFSKFSDPVAGTSGRTAFVATIAGLGVKATNRSGLWYFDGTANLHLVARTGDPALGGGKWFSFESLALPDGPQSAPLFVATLARDAVAGISAANNRGLWAIDSTGTLQPLLKTGQSVKVNGVDRTVKNFVALAPIVGAPGVASGYTDQQEVSAVITCVDGTVAVVNIAIP